VWLYQQLLAGSFDAVSGHHVFASGECRSVPGIVAEAIQAVLCNLVQLGTVSFLEIVSFLLIGKAQYPFSLCALSCQCLLMPIR
jgi:hypothetical protein